MGEQTQSGRRAQAALLNLKPRISMSVLLRANNLVKSYRSPAAEQERAVALNGVSLAAARGEIIAIVGSSGAGKSTLLHLLGALDEADEGEITLYPRGGGEYVYSHLKVEELSALRNRAIGFVFQFHHLLPEFTALENVKMPMLIAGMSHKEARTNAAALLERVGLAERFHNKPDALSGGEQQRVACARALANNPDILFADEPTGNLDAANSMMILNLFKEWREKHGQTIVIVTHSAEIAAGADRIIRLDGGKIASP